MSPRAAALATLSLLACSPSAPEPVAGAAPWIRVERPRRHAVLIVIDTLRADTVDAATTPHLDALAATGQVPRAWSAGTWTAPSVISMFTGLPVRAHGWDFPFPRYMDRDNERYPPVPDQPTLAEVLRAEGFRTDGLYGNRLLREGLGFDRGFETWRFTNDSRAARRVAELVAGWDDDDRHFLYVHLLGPHHPLRPRARSPLGHRRRTARPRSLMRARDGDPRKQRAYRRAYRAVVEDSDRRVGRILQALGDYRDDAVVVVTSDHGELLGEHGQWGHEHYVWEPLTHVPFVADGVGPLPPALNTTAVPALISAGVGVAHPWPSEGLSVGPIVSQRQGKLAFSPDGTTKAIWDPGVFPGEGVAAFDLSLDPGEEHPQPGLVAPLVQARAAWEDTVPPRALAALPGGMSEEEVGMLEQLGYMGDGGDDGDDGSDGSDGSDGTEGDDAAPAPPMPRAGAPSATTGAGPAPPLPAPGAGGGGE